MSEGVKECVSWQENCTELGNVLTPSNPHPIRIITLCYITLCYTDEDLL